MQHLGIGIGIGIGIGLGLDPALKRGGQSTVGPRAQTSKEDCTQFLPNKGLNVKKTWVSVSATHIDLALSR